MHACVRACERRRRRECERRDGGVLVQWSSERPVVARRQAGAAPAVVGGSSPVPGSETSSQISTRINCERVIIVFYLMGSVMSRLMSNTFCQPI